MARQIVVDIVGDASKFNRATNSAVSNAQRLDGKLRNVGKGLAIGAGVGGFLALNTAISAGIGLLFDADKAFREDEVSQDLLAQALKNNIPAWDGNTAAIEKYASAQAKLGFQDDDIRASIGQLIGITHDLTEAQTLNSLAQDLARAKGIDLATASDVITKALQGNSRALKAYGIDISDASTAAEILDAIQKNVKDSAEAWAATSEGKVAVANVKVAESMERLGAVVDKVAQFSLPILADFLEDITTHLGETGEKIEEAIQDFKNLSRAAREFFNLDQGRGGSGSFAPAGPVTPKIRMPFGMPVPRFHSGGTVPGAPGSDVLTMLQAGERVLPRSQAGGSSMVLNFYAPVYSEGPAFDDLLNQITQRVRVAAGT